MENIIHEIDAFIAATGMSESTFGRLAVSDGKLIGDLRGREGVKPRELRRATEAKIRHFMETHGASIAA
jgi:hypothetical protein